MSKKRKERSVTIRLEYDLYIELLLFSAKCDRNISETIRLILRRMLSNESD